MKQGTVSISSTRGLAPASSPRDPGPGHQCLQPPTGQKGLRALGAAVQSWDMITAHPLRTEPTPGVGSKGCPQGKGNKTQRAPPSGEESRGYPRNYLGCSVGHRARAALAELLQLLSCSCKDLVQSEQVGAHEG